MKFIYLEKRFFKTAMIFYLIFLHSCGGGGTKTNISNEPSSEPSSETASKSESSTSNQNSNVDQSLTFNIEIVENRFGECNFGECKFE